MQWILGLMHYYVIAFLQRRSRDTENHTIQIWSLCLFEALVTMFPVNSPICMCLFFPLIFHYVSFGKSLIFLSFD